MKNYEDSIKRLQKNLCYSRDSEVRRKGEILLEALKNAKIKKTAIKYGISRKTLHDWLNNLKAAEFDLAALKNQSRRPHRSPRKTPDEIEELVVNIANEFGNSDIIVAGRLQRETGKTVSHSAICKILKRRKISQPYRKIKKEKHPLRYVAAAPLDRTQIDTAELGICDIHGNKVYFVAMIDDHSKVVRLHVNNSKGVVESLACLKKFIESYGMPTLVQSDNGTEFTNKYVSLNNPRRLKEAVMGAFEIELGRLEVEHHLIKPGTPELNGKIERFNGTIKTELRRHLKAGMTLAQIIAVVAWYEKYYNNDRPHTALKKLTPHEKFYGIRAARLAG